MDYRVRLSRSARADIQDIVRYISADNPRRALQFGRFLLLHTKNLGQLPARGRVVPELEDDAIREIIVRSCRVVYRVDHTKRIIEVVRFWHAGRGTPDLLK